MSAGFSLLVVDDSDSIRELIVIELEDLGITIHQACSGTEALETYTNNKIDFIITDINMPEGNGIYFLKEIRTMDKPVPPAILISGMVNLSQLELEQLGIIKTFENFLDLVEIRNIVLSKIQAARTF
jgi:CheY-like chemotaxis protein